MINRVDVSRALAKAIAYKNCGEDKKAAQWAAKLVVLLECAEILEPVWARVPREMEPVDINGDQ